MTSTFRRRRLASHSRADGIGFQALIDLAVLVPVALALGEDVRPIRAALQGARDHFLGMPEAVHRGGVDPIDAAIEGLVDGGDRLVVVLRTPGECPSASRPSPTRRRRSGVNSMSLLPRRFFCISSTITNVGSIREKTRGGDRFGSERIVGGNPAGARRVRA